MKMNVRNATIDDLPFVASLYSEAVAGGHFASNPSVAVFDMLKDWLVKGAITRDAMLQDGTEVVEKVPIKFLVSELNGALAGFLITSPQTAKTTEVIEIYLLGVSKTARRQGVATNLIEYGERQHGTSGQFYARCYPKSTWAISLFKQKGYALESVSPNSRVHYFWKNSSPV